MLFTTFKILILLDIERHSVKNYEIHFEIVDSNSQSLTYIVTQGFLRVSCKLFLHVFCLLVDPANYKELMTST